MFSIGFNMYIGFEETYPLYNSVNLIERRSILNASKVDEYLTVRARAVVMILANTCRG